VPMAEALALVRRQALVAEARRLGAERLPRKTRFELRREAEPGCRVLDLLEVLDRVARRASAGC
jgi:hypothetical protein